MTRMCWTTFAKGLRRVALAAALAALALPVDALANGNYGYKGSGWSSNNSRSYTSSSGKSYSHGRSYSSSRGGSSHKSYRSHKSSGKKPTVTRTVRSSPSGSRRILRANYRTGGSGHGWLNQWGRGSTNNGYTGANTSISTPHRSDWNSKLRAQRQWDEQEFKKMQQADGNSARCGLSNAPAYCYRLMGPYPKETYVVRY